MYIRGIGIISNYGRGLNLFKAALEKDGAGDIFSSRVNEDTLNDKIFSKAARRSDRFTRMAVLAAREALASSGINSEAEQDNIGVILATGFGPHVTTFRFLDDILSYKEPEVSAILFSHSVHNAAVSYISSLIGIRGPTLTFTRFFRAFDQALLLAAAWLKQKKARYVLVGAAEEYSPIMEYIAKPNSDIRLGEGSVFFMLSEEKPSKGDTFAGLIPLKPEHITYLPIASSELFQSAFNRAAEIIVKINFNQAEKTTRTSG